MVEKTIIKTKEGSADNYYRALAKAFGGKVENGSYKVKNKDVEIYMSAYALSDDIEMIVSSGTYNKTIVLDREPDDDPNYIHINIIKEGQLTQSYTNQKQYLQADTTKGIFVHNGMFPLKAVIPPYINYRAIGLNFKKSAIETLMPEAIGIYETFFGDDKPIAYHLQASKEVERLTDDIFYFREAPFASQTLAMARGLEVFSTLFIGAKNQLENDTIQGLHVDDYNRLLKIKDKLLSSFNQKISVETIAKEFGISNSKLKRDFRTLFDCSLYQFYTHAKMDEAYRLLKSGQYSVMDVGYSLGYQNLSKFSLMFKKVKGISPKDVSQLNTNLL